MKPPAGRLPTHNVDDTLVDQLEDVFRGEAARAAQLGHGQLDVVLQHLAGQQDHPLAFSHGSDPQPGSRVERLRLGQRAVFLWYRYCDMLS